MLPLLPLTQAPRSGLAGLLSAGVEEVKAAVNWTVGHQLPRAAVAHAAGRGDLQCRLIQAGSGDGDLWQIVEEVRAHGRLHEARRSYLTVDHATAREVLTSADFASTNPIAQPGLLGRLLEWSTGEGVHPLRPPSLLVSEPPSHTRYRRLVTRVFTVSAVEALRERTRGFAEDLLDALDPRGARGARSVAADPIDLVPAYCSALPVQVISHVLGVPADQQDRVLAFGAAAAPSLDFGLGWSDHRAMRAGLGSFADWLVDHFEHLRRHPGDDLLSRLVQARDDQGALSEDELVATAGLVLAAGFETTVNLLGNAVMLLAANPGELDRARRDPALWSGVVDETLRLDPPVLLTAREAIRPTTVAGTQVPAGAEIVTILAGANRDSAVFPEPSRMDITRANVRDHLAFSSGRHYCLGASLARMEGEEGLRALYGRFPDLRPLPGARRRSTRILRGYAELPVRLA